MNTKPVCAPSIAQKATRNEQVTTVVVLAVGSPEEWVEQGNPLPSGGMAFLSFSELSESILSQYNPSVVFSPVLAPTFDCIDLAILLHNLGFMGSYRAMAKDLPKPELIEREVAHICPRLDFSIVVAN